MALLAQKSEQISTICLLLNDKKILNALKLVFIDPDLNENVKRTSITTWAFWNGIVRMILVLGFWHLWTTVI